MPQIHYEGVTFFSSEIPAWETGERLRRAAAQKRVLFPDASRLDADASQNLSGLADTRSERAADRNVSEYDDGATELMTQQTQPATEELNASQLGSQLRQKGAE